VFRCKQQLSLVIHIAMVKLVEYYLLGLSVYVDQQGGGYYELHNSALF
jgi:hypothetical protein